MNITTDYASVPLPAGAEAYETEWHESPNGATHYRRFATKKFPVFDWLATSAERAAPMRRTPIGPRRARPRDGTQIARKPGPRAAATVRR